MMTSALVSVDTSEWRYRQHYVDMDGAGSLRKCFILTTHSTHFICGYMASDIWLRTILIVRKETRCRHIGYFFRLAARVLLYAPSHRQDNTYHGLCYTSRGALAGIRNSSMGPGRGSQTTGACASLISGQVLRWTLSVNYICQSVKNI